MDASIIIPTHNRRQWVISAVRALLRQDYPLDSYEVIVCCDRCTDGSEESLKATFGDQVTTVRSNSPGQTGALNTGLRYARGAIAIMLDDEMEAEECFVSAHVRMHRAGPIRMAVTGYSTVILDSGSTLFTRTVARDYEKYFAELSLPKSQSSPNDLCGSNFSVPTAAFAEVGGFNESYFFQRNDFELAVRLLQAGYEIRFCRAAKTRQHLAITAEDVISRTTERARNDCRLAREYPWCVPYLSFYRVLANPSVRRRWRLLWETAGIAARLFRAARIAFPRNVRLGEFEYASRYCLGLRLELGNWKAFCRLVDETTLREA